ncbi:MAG: flagellar FlbD family protein [Thermoleophilia bacterium]
MITLHKLNGEPVVLNAELIETVESTPDTLITLVDRRRLMVGESVSEVVQRVVDYRRVVSGAPVAAAAVAIMAAEAE